MKENPEFPGKKRRWNLSVTQQTHAAAEPARFIFDWGVSEAQEWLHSSRSPEKGGAVIIIFWLLRFCRAPLLMEEITQKIRYVYIYIYLYVYRCIHDMYLCLHTPAVWNPANQLRLVVYPTIYQVSYIPGGFLAGFLKHQTKNWARIAVKTKCCFWLFDIIFLRKKRQIPIPKTPKHSLIWVMSGHLAMSLLLLPLVWIRCHWQLTDMCLQPCKVGHCRLAK